MAEQKTRARLEILHYITEFSLQRYLGAHAYDGSRKMSFHDTGFGGAEAIPGDLVALQSAPVSKWYLGWLVSRQSPDGWVEDQLTIESIEDGELCNWNNVGLLYFSRETVAEHPEWRWTDKQFEFKDRWWKVCFKDRDAYIHLPTFPVFFDDGSVEIGVRVRFQLDPTVIRRTFPNWKKLTKKELLAFFDEASATLKARPKASA